VLATIVSRCQVVPLNNRIEENLGLLSDLSQLKDGRNISTLSRHPENLEIYDKLKGEGFLHADKHRHDSREALALAQTLQGLLEEDYSADQVLDVALTMELQALKTVSGASASAYLATLMRLCEEAKREIDQYVSKKAVCESFVLSWLKLRQNFNNQ
jgi:hypothetical protein